MKKSFEALARRSLFQFIGVKAFEQTDLKVLTNIHFKSI